MPGLFYKYYFDVTKFNIFFSALAAILTGRFTTGAITFASAGILISLLAYRQLHNVQYYFYLNGGLFKNAMIGRMVTINFIIGLTLTLFAKIIF